MNTIPFSKTFLAILLLAACNSLHGQDSLYLNWLAHAPQVLSTPVPINQRNFDWASKLEMPLPDAPNQGWMLVSVRTDASGAFMGHCFATETNSAVDQWFLKGLRSTLIQDSLGNPLEGWTAIQYGYCLPCGTTRVKALRHTHISQSQPVNSQTAGKPREFTPGLQEVTPVDFHNFAKTIPYPEHLKAAGIEGKVYVHVRVNHFGRYMEHMVLRSAHPDLSKAVASRLKDLRFLPTIFKDGRGSAWTTLPFSFRLP